MKNNLLSSGFVFSASVLFLFFSVSVVSAAVPATPTGLSASCGNDGKWVLVAWNNVSGASEYHLRLDGNPTSFSGDCNHLNSGDWCEVRYSNSALLSITPNTDYLWWVHAVNSDGWSHAAQFSFKCTPQNVIVAPSNPSGLTTTCSPSGTSVSFSWNNVSSATGYLFRLDKNPNSWSYNCNNPSAGDRCDTLGSNSFNNVAITPNTNYEWWVHAVNSAGQGDHSSIASFNCPITNVAMCTASIPANASTFDAEESTDLSSSQNWAYSASDTATKCQYKCNSGYNWNGSSCVLLAPGPCPAGVSKTWTAGSNSCNGTTPATGNGASGSINDSTAPTTGIASYLCTNGAWATNPNSGATCLISVPATPTGLTVTPQACGTGQNFLDWNDASDATSYSIYSSSGTWIGNSIGSNYTHTGSLSTMYSYYVQANNAVGQSGNSGVSSGTTAGACPVVSATLITNGCTIVQDASTCNDVISWTITNGTAPFKTHNDTNGIIYGTAVTGSVSGQLKHGLNLIKVEDNSGVLENKTVSANCISGTTWNATSNTCELAVVPPTLNIGATPYIVRSGQTAHITTTVDSAYDLNCIIYSDKNHPYKTFTHSGTTNSYGTYVTDTNSLYSAQIVVIECSNALLPVSGSAETRVEIIPRMQEI